MEYIRFPGAADEPPCPGKGYVDVVFQTIKEHLNNTRYFTSEIACVFLLLY